MKSRTFIDLVWESRSARMNEWKLYQSRGKDVYKMCFVERNMISCQVLQRKYKLCLFVLCSFVMFACCMVR